ncbi:MAG: glycosyltransferase family 4 protein [Candidatus Woesearchaeota archaeon]
MFGWELPPLYAGGIGMVCYDLIKELTAQNVHVTYLMPFGPKDFPTDTNAQIVVAEQAFPELELSEVDIRKVHTLFNAYQSPQEYEQAYKEQLKREKERGVRKNLYGPNLFAEVDLFAKRAYELIDDVEFDVIHAHDWMTFPAAIGVKQKTGKPLIVHVHNTIFDRYLGNASPHEKNIECSGLEHADVIVVVSNYIKNTLVDKYHVDPNKIQVIHNAPNSLLRNVKKKTEYKLDIGDDKMVLFTGRMTMQKGPEYFVHCAKKVLEHRDDVTFVMAGSGDLFENTINLASHLGISHKFLFTGFYTMDQAKSLYQRADCYIMPSVSEPFGIVPLEAMDEGAPTMITRTSGCSEVIHHALKIDFWDIHQMANKVLAVLEYPQLKQELKLNGQAQVSSMNWSKPATLCKTLYHSLSNQRQV